MNEAIKKFEMELVSLINSSKLPPSILYYILDSKTQQVAKLFEQDLQIELAHKDEEPTKDKTPEIEVTEG